MSEDHIYRVYSRKRFGWNGNRNGLRKLKKFLPFCICIFIGFLVFRIVWNSVNPIFTALCRDEAKSIATIITNEKTTEVMEQYDYDNFFTIEKDENGNIQMITANVLKINQITSQIALYIQDALNDSDNNKIYIPIGSITGIKFLSGMGPKIPIKISTTGTIETNVKSEFVSQGVNQTLHRVYIEIQANVSILLSNETIDESIYNQILILENVIVGEIPSTYFSIEE